MRKVTKEFTVSTHKGKGEDSKEVPFTATYNAPETYAECLEAVRGEENAATLIREFLISKAFGAGKNTIYNFTLTGDKNTAEAREKCLADAVAKVADYVWEPKGESVKSKADAADAAREILKAGGTMEEIRAALGL